MPYIKSNQRDKFSDAVRELGELISDVGELNYVITSIAHRFTIKTGVNYAKLSAVHGVLNDAAAEFYRVVMAPYEDKKIYENGNVSELDAGPNRS